MDDLTAIQTRVSMPWFLTLLGEAQAVDRQYDQALATFGEALTINPEERLYRPYTLINRGELRAQAGERDLAELDFRASVDEAGSMGANGYDLRAATGLARLLSARGATEEAASLLRRRLEASITGFDTVDIAAARDSRRGRQERRTPGAGVFKGSRPCGARWSNRRRYQPRP